MNAFNAVISDTKRIYERNLKFSNHEESKTHGYSKFFLTKVCKAFKAIFPRKCGETDKAWKLGLNVVAMLVSANMSWPSRITHKLNMLRFEFLVRVLQKFRQFQYENVVKEFFFTFFLNPGYNFFLNFLCNIFSLDPCVPVDRFQMPMYHG